ncbi:hypothetical protein FRC03_010517 [Tulasnella sp. 419]|nr:hypothetical protein FRC02_007391 [Tulasnella sp. 418]KAG8957124.1 hypothetical protein FRC03_010517 [Tulasnella sp. 419]
MSHHPAYTMSGLCAIGGVVGFLRTRSVPSLVAGVSVGALYGWSATRIQNGVDNGYKGAFAASVLLLVSSLPRIRKGPVPAVLSATALASTLYYAKVLNDFELWSL